MLITSWIFVDIKITFIGATFPFSFSCLILQFFLCIFSFYISLYFILIKLVLFMSFIAVFDQFFYSLFIWMCHNSLKWEQQQHRIMYIFIVLIYKRTKWAAVQINGYNTNKLFHFMGPGGRIWNVEWEATRNRKRVKQYALNWRSLISSQKLYLMFAWVIMFKRLLTIDVVADGW